MSSEKYPPPRTSLAPPGNGEDGGRMSSEAITLSTNSTATAPPVAGDGGWLSSEPKHPSPPSGTLPAACGHRSTAERSYKTLTPGSGSSKVLSRLQIEKRKSKLGTRTKKRGRDHLCELHPLMSDDDIDDNQPSWFTSTDYGTTSMTEDEEGPGVVPVVVPGVVVPGGGRPGAVPDGQGPAHPANQELGGGAPGTQSCVTKIAQTHWKACQATCFMVIGALLIVMIVTLSLMIYYLVKVEKTGDWIRTIEMSTSEVYNLKRVGEDNKLSLYREVCIEKIEEQFDNVGVYLKHGRSSDIKPTMKQRTISHSLNGSEQLNFFWIENTEFNLTFTAMNSCNITVFVYTPEESKSECTFETPQNYTYKLVFPNSTDPEVSCSVQNASHYTYRTENKPINNTGRYHMCIKSCCFDTQQLPYFTLHVNEKRYDTNVSKFESKSCQLEQDDCCVSDDNIFNALFDLTHTLVETEPSGGDDAYPLPQPLSIKTRKHLEGLIYLLSIIAILIIMLASSVCLCGYACYRKRHPQGYCLILNHVCVC